MISDFTREKEDLKKRLSEMRASLDLGNKQVEIDKLEEQMNKPDFWDNREQAQSIVQQVNRLKEVVGDYKDLETKLQDLEEWLELAAEAEEDKSLLAEAEDSLKELREGAGAMELEIMLSGPHDGNNAIFTLHPGAGGTESQDWAEMLLRMYTRWCEKKGYQVDILDMLPGDDAGIKSVTLLVKGKNAYGYLKAERGVHRLVRISPFDSSGRRHTSFASVDVVPEVEETEDVEIDSSELKIDTYRAGGAGGQHVNKTDSAVRITHLPTGIVVQCQNERSQMNNRNVAMKILKARLYEKKLREQEAELEALRGEQQEIAWGSQIRSYVFHPYSMVKDHRTNVEDGNVEGVMNGQIDKFIGAYLQKTTSV
ncbi:peptide chain release factor 2 [Desulfitispora alkaliphila]|uniref:peptide chain release factor 2 n=1 Tax=Desulfitispora alkaliphila TaxID=622674 RepID=UPI003D242AFD